MSAIAAFASPVPHPAPGALVSRMLGALVRPAAPGVAVWPGAEPQAGPAALGARVAREADGPAVHGPTGCVAVADARLDDPDDLGAVLGLPPGAPAAEVVLHAYLAWGPACVDRLDGDFALAVWDARDRSLFAARDRFGLRPLVYASRDGGLWLGSQPRALLQDPALPRTPDRWRVAELLTGMAFDGERSFFEAIQRLPPGNALRWSGGAVRTWPYWRPTRSETSVRSLRDAADAFRERFDRSVRRRLDTPRAVGAALSGGLDSSSVVTTVRALRGAGPPLPTFTALYPGVELADERSFSLAVEAGGGLDPHAVYPLAHSPIADHEADRLGIDEPLSMPTWAMERNVLHAVRDAGVGVFLTGHGGDHLLTTGPDGYFGDLLRGGRWGRLTREARAYRGGAAVREALVSVALRDAVRASLPAAVRHLRPPPAPGTLAPEFARGLRFAERARALAPPLRTATEWHAAMLHHPITHDGLDRMVRISAALGISFVSPFWDRALADLCLSLPRDVFYRDGVERVLIREAMAGRLPEVVRRRRSKATFNPLLNLTLMRDEREAVLAMLDAPGYLAGVANMDALRGAVGRLDGRSDEDLARASPGDAAQVLRALTLWLWVRRQAVG